MKNIKINSYLATKLVLISFILLFSNITYAQETIKIGGIFTLSGFGAIAGNSESNAARMAINEINSKGGINGKKIEFILENNESNLRKTADVTNKLINVNKVNFIIGPNWAEFAEVAAPIVQRYKIPMISTTGNTEGLVNNKDYVFTLFPSNKKAVIKYVDFILEHKYKEHILLVAENAYYQEIAMGVKEEFARRGKTIKEEYSHSPEDLDFRSILTKLKNRKNTAIIAFTIDGSGTYTFLKQKRDLNFKLPIFQGSAIPYSPTILKEKELVNNIYFFDYKKIANKEFISKYKSIYKEDPIMGATQAYDSVYLLKEAIENCDNKKIQTCILNTKLNGITGNLVFNSEGEVIFGKDTIDIYKGENKEFEIIK